MSNQFMPLPIAAWEWGEFHQTSKIRSPRIIYMAILMALCPVTKNMCSIYWNIDKIKLVRRLESCFDLLSLCGISTISSVAPVCGWVNFTHSFSRVLAGLWAKQQSKIGSLYRHVCYMWMVHSHQLPPACSAIIWYGADFYIQTYQGGSLVLPCMALVPAMAILYVALSNDKARPRLDDEILHAPPCRWTGYQQ